MKKITLIIFLSFFLTNIYSQTDKVFWNENFSKGIIPEGWKTVVENDSSVNWVVTDQPYPGSWGRNYQAPPIASASRGFHLQYSPGVKVDKFYRKWNKVGKYPNSYIQTSTIDCSKKRSVVLKFQQNFFWHDRMIGNNAGLFVGVSNDGKNWVEWEVIKQNYEALLPKEGK